MDLLQLIDPELAPAIQMMPAEGVFNFDDLNAGRAMAEKMISEMVAQLPAIEGVYTEDRTVPGPENSPDVLVRIYVPEGRSDRLPAMLWIHGGGYIMGSVNFDDNQMKQVVNTIGCMVVSVDYRLAPENPFPAPVEDCYAALKWMAANADALGIEKSRIAIGGGSAGGGLAAGLALLTRDRAEVDIILQVLIYPMIDDRNVTPSSRAIIDPRTWNRDSNLFAWKAYLGKAAERGDVSPYAAASRAADLAGLPPAYIVVGELDLFVDEDIEYAQRLIQAGVPTELHVYPRATHAFDTIVTASVSKRFMAERDEAIRRALFE